MNKNTPQLNTRLSPDERAEMKHSFMAYMEANPVPAMRTSSRSPYFPQIFRLQTVALASFLFILTGSAYAAEASLPNDFLYPVKTEVIEPLFIQAPAVTGHAKARANSTLITRRLEEAQALVDEDALSPEIAAYLAIELDAHAAEIQEYVEDAALAGDLSEAFEMSTEVETTLEAHTDVLESVADEHLGIGAAIDELLEDVEDEAEEAADSGDRLEIEVSARLDGEAEEFLKESHRDIAETLEELRESALLLDASEDELIQDAQALLEESGASREASVEALSAGNTREAVEQARDSLRAAKRAVIFIESHEAAEEQ